MNEDEIARNHFIALTRKHAEDKQTFSVIIEGYSVQILRRRKKSAGQSGSRGKYISKAILYFEENKTSPQVIQQFEDQLFKLQLRIFHLERTLRENGVKVPE